MSWPQALLGPQARSSGCRARRGSRVQPRKELGESAWLNSRQGPAGVHAYQSSCTGESQSSASTTDWGSAPGERVQGPATSAGAEWGRAPSARRITRKGTVMVGRGSPGAGLGAALATDSLGREPLPSISAPSGSRLGAVRPGPGEGRRWPPASGDVVCHSGAPRSRRTRRRRAAGGWRRAREAPAPLRTAPPSAAPVIQPPRGRAGLLQVSRRRLSTGVGLRAPKMAAASRGDSRGNNSRRRSKGGRVQGSGEDWRGSWATRGRGPCQRRRAPRSMPSPSKTRMTRKSTISAKVVGW